MKYPGYTDFATPLGTLTLCGTERGLTGLYMEDHRHGPEERHRLGWERNETLFTEARSQLEEYFAGRRQSFTMPIDRDALGGTEFQRRVWAELEKIPYGATISYGEQARRLGTPAAMRAVGAANGRNPISIVVPCHRVIGAGGSLTGYGGGMANKRWLIDLERGGTLRI